MKRRISAASNDMLHKIFADQFIGIILIPKNKNMTSKLSSVFGDRYRAPISSKLSYIFLVKDNVKTDSIPSFLL